ncbi:hypothetical protein RhiJN_00344 [Ceratobasidium sp. AG-Ba]|nr:hypothetical protein RhiJN_00344 [Ceratobasidium sp. AG-Ba]
MCNAHTESSTSRENSAPDTTGPVVESTVTVLKTAPKFRFFPTCCHRPSIRRQRPAMEEEPKSESTKRKTPDDGSRLTGDSVLVYRKSVRWSFTLEEDSSKRQKVDDDDEWDSSDSETDDGPVEYIRRGPPPPASVEP